MRFMRRAKIGASTNALRRCATNPMGLKVLAPGETLSAGLAMTVFDWSDDNG
jgi:aldose 1-epimerase